MKERNGSDYAYIRAWSRLMGSMSYYTEAQVARARETGAPADAIYERHEGGLGRTGEWAVFEDIASVLTREHVQAAVDKIRGRG
jgi:hypothetical protein